MKLYLNKIVTYTNTTTAALLAVVVFLVFTNCRRASVNQVADIDFEIDSSYTMRAQGVSTLISDSGITRYRLTTPEWLIFSRNEKPYWHFPQGLFVEHYDTLFSVIGDIKADTAYYHIYQKEWVLIGNVVIRNVNGERFDSDQITWDQGAGRVYSDQFIRIDQGDKVITGVGFESNQEMTKYQIFNPQGIFPIDQQSDSISPSDGAVMPASVGGGAVADSFGSDAAHPSVRRGDSLPANVAVDAPSLPPVAPSFPSDSFPAP